MKRLLQAGSPALRPGHGVESGLDPQLVRLLGHRNGFFAFEGALHVFPSGSEDDPNALQGWNSPSLWRDLYSGVERFTFFAEDAFGVQFALTSSGLVTLEPETGAVVPIAHGIEGWADALVDDWENLTGHPVARAWQLENRALREGERLMPRVPFVLGGEFEVANLVAVDSVVGMRERGQLASYLRGVPEGTQIDLAACGWTRHLAL